jgi:transcription elongation factor
MSDSLDSNITQSSPGGSKVNDQVVDSIKEINSLLEDGRGNLDSISSQILTQAAGMAMLNVVNQQQQMFMLQNTVTTVAAKAMLESNPLDAVKMMEEVMNNNSAASSIKELQDLVDRLTND